MFTELQLYLLQVSSNGSEDLQRDRRITRVLLAVNCLKSGNSCKNSWTGGQKLFNEIDGGGKEEEEEDVYVQVLERLWEWI